MNNEQRIWVTLLMLGGLFLMYRAATAGSGSVFVREVDGIEQFASAWEAEMGIARLSVSRTVGVWVAAIFTLCIFSFLYRDNPWYKTAEAVVVGVSAAYWMVVGFWTTLIPNLFGKLLPTWIKSWAVPGISPVRESFWFLYFIPLLLGVMLLWRLSPKGAWIARWPLAFIIGTTAGIRLVGFIQADFLSQIRGSIRPLIAADLATVAANVTLVVGVLACLTYFFFSIEHKGWVGRVSQVGIWFLMITFGAAFGYTVMGRIALLAIRLEFLFDEWLWLIDPTGSRPPGWSRWW